MHELERSLGMRRNWGVQPSQHRRAAPVGGVTPSVGAGGTRSTVLSTLDT